MIHDTNEERLAVCKKEDSFFVTIGPGNVKGKVLELTGDRSSTSA